MNVLLSVKPKYAEAIFSGTKRYEFRRTIFRRKNVRRVYVYSNSSVKKIIGSFEIEKILKGTPREIWDRCHRQGGISKEDFFEYFDGTRIAYGIKIKNASRLNKPIEPTRVFEDFAPPQSFYYIKHDLPEVSG